MLADNPYSRDDTFINNDAFVFYLEGKKGAQASEWRDGSQELKDYKDFDVESRERALNFIRASAEAEKPFFVSWWPLWISFIANPEKTTLQRGLVARGLQAHYRARHCTIAQHIRGIGYRRKHVNYSDG